MKKLLSLVLALTLIVTSLAGVAFAADPIAEVTNGDKTQKVYAVDDMRDLVKPDGTTKIKLLSDVTHNVAIEFCGAVELDLNGFTIKAASGNCIRISNTTENRENQHTVVKNGTVIGVAVMGIRVNYGSLELRDCTVFSPKSVAVGIYEPDTKYNEKNIIDNCTLIAGGGGCFSWHAQPSGTGQPPCDPQVGLNIKIQNTTMVQFTEGNNAIQTRTPEGGSFVTLGDNVTIYANEYSQTYVNPGITLQGKELKQVEGSFSYEYSGNKYPMLAKYETGAPAPVVPETPATPAQPATPSTPAVPTTPAPDVEVPKTGVSVMALGVMALVSLAGAVITKKH